LSIESIRDEIYAEPRDLLEKFSTAISIAVVIPISAINSIAADSSGTLYAHAYRAANILLDTIAFSLVQHLIEHGFTAQPIPASLIVDERRAIGNISHKLFAHMVGLGWIGRNLLLVNPKYGPRIRLATILANLKLSVENRMMKC